MLEIQVESSTDYVVCRPVGELERCNKERRLEGGVFLCVGNKSPCKTFILAVGNSGLRRNNGEGMGSHPRC